MQNIAVLLTDLLYNTEVPKVFQQYRAICVLVFLVEENLPLGGHISERIHRGLARAQTPIYIVNVGWIPG
jgi:hypothetical protein